MQQLCELTLDRLHRMLLYPTPNLPYALSCIRDLQMPRPRGGSQFQYWPSHPKTKPKKEWRPFVDNLQVEHHLELFPDMIHGWMSARGDLEDEKVRKEFQKGHQMVLDWFGKHT